MKLSTTFKIIFGFLLVLLVAVISSVYHIDFSNYLSNVNNKLANDSRETKKIKVDLVKCIDGDTAKFKMADGSIKTARFLAIDTPESVHPTKAVEAYGKEASEFTCNLLTKANSIKIEYDKASDKTDKYGRLLVWVYADNKLVQEMLLREGLAKVAYLYADYEYTSYLQEIEKDAKNKKLKIWSDENIANNMDATETDEFAEEETTNSIFDIILNLIKDFICNLFKKILNS